MPQESRVKKTLLNARVNLIFYFLTLALSFFSRKIFLDCLGADFIGLTGTLQNLLGFLNLAELGIGSAIGYVLYKPLFDHDQQKINEIISVMGYLYRWIGLFILGGGCLLACFLPWIFSDTQFDLSLIYFAYFSFLASSLIGYFINYRQNLLGADQRNYVVTAYFQTSNIVKTLIQMASAYYTGSYFLWVAIELSFGIVYSFILNWKINQTYPWLRCNVAFGKKSLSNNRIILIKSRQIYIHNIAAFGRYQLLPFLVYAFTSLQTVAYYGNYMTVIDKVQQMIGNVIGSTGAGVGNLIAEGEEDKILKTYWTLNAMKHIIASISCFMIYQMIDPLISLWLGEQYVLEKVVLFVILCNIFIGFVRGTNNEFINGYGLFQDTWAPIVTLIITIVVAAIMGYFYGLVGVLSGDVASSVTIISIWKPYFLFSRGFKKPFKIYCVKIGKYMIAIVLTSIIGNKLIQLLGLVSDSLVNLITNTIIILCMYSILIISSMFVVDKESMLSLCRYAKSVLNKYH